MAPWTTKTVAESPRGNSAPAALAALRSWPARPRFRRGASSRVQLVVAALLVLAALLLASYLLSGARPVARQREFLLAFGLIGLWRWGWAGLHYARAIVYRYWMYPRLQRRALRAQRARGGVREVVVLATTYHEDPWITRTVFESLFAELASLEGLPTRPRVVVVTGGADDDAAVERAHVASMAVNRRGLAPQLLLMRGTSGKRPAIARGLRELAEWDLGRDSVVLLMDGDTQLRPGLLHKVLPLFCLPEGFAAVTTNEDGYTDGPAWFSEWISLRFGQRHLSMCSLALSRRLLCLTGRLSAFRGDVATDPEFCRQIEDDRLDHWLYGQFAMLSGDDKSSWFYLAERGQRMLYVPDALATTYEVVEDAGGRRAIANLNRWSGNMLRNSWRAIRLGPWRMGLFPWLCLIDQRIAMWTCLIGPTAAMLAALAGRFEWVAGYLLWVIVSRSMRVAAACRHGRRVSACYVPAQLLSEWVGSVVKLWVSFHPVKQQWFNRGRQRLDASRDATHRNLRRALACYLLGFSCAAFALIIAMYLNLIPLWRELPLAWRGRAASVWRVERNTPAPDHREFFGAE